MDLTYPLFAFKIRFERLKKPKSHSVEKYYNFRKIKPLKDRGDGGGDRDVILCCEAEDF